MSNDKRQETKTTAGGNVNRPFLTVEDPMKVCNTTQEYGIVNSSLSATDIPDNIIERGDALGKLASSMPTALARLFIFDSALKEVNAIQAADPQGGHRGKYDFNVKEYLPTPYHELVGDMLDMLEFIFEYGGQKHFGVIEWNLGNETAKLQDEAVTQNIGHKRLAHALESSMELAGFLNPNVNFNTIYLFTWKGKVVGGTSPMSLVYTSANLRDSVRNENLRGRGGNILFSGDSIPLNRRHSDFRKYIYGIYYKHLTSGTVGMLNNLATYISDSIQRYPDAENSATNVKNGKDLPNTNPVQYTNGKIKTSVTVGPVSLRYSDRKIQISKDTSDYMLAPTVKVYQHGNPGKQIPLALTPSGVNSLVYSKKPERRMWIYGSDIIPTVLDPIIDNRLLPGLGTKYPYLAPQDFFEDKIIEVSYNINKGKFFTGSEKNIGFLLPIKKIFFEYFSVDDLFVKDLASGEVKYTDMLTIVYDEDTETVDVKLTLPLVNGNKIEFFKCYNVAEGSIEKVDCYDGSSTFDMAFFPFYRLIPDNGNNVYNVMVGATVDKVVLSFFNPEDGEGLKDVKSENNVRLERAVGSPMSTNHINVEGAFTFAEISVQKEKGQDPTTALIIPIMREEPSTGGKGRYTFAIDFGTTNTHVAYGVDTGAGMGEIHPFDYGIKNTQVVMFNDEAGVAEFGMFKTAVKRELVPEEIGTDSKDVVKFPMRTSTYQAQHAANLKLFANTNIGFNYGSDISNARHYRTNIKWEQGVESKDRMATFFEQMLWMMKNKSVLDKCTDSFNVVYTYPIAMSEDAHGLLNDAWEAAKKSVRCNATLKDSTESIAPYYASNSMKTYGEPFMNMDIGGGTTDMLYVNPTTTETYVFSAFFAANDLWNDGLDPKMKVKKGNGFLEYFKATRLKKLSEEDKQIIKAVMESASSSEDIISYLFSNDSTIRLTDTIAASDKMRQLPAVHFSALMFYLAYCIHMVEVTPPTQLSFSGMGSKYIKLVSRSNSALSILVNTIFHYAGEAFDNDDLKNANISISFDDTPKEITAKGALMAQYEKKPLVPDPPKYFHGYDDEDSASELRIEDVNINVLDKVGRFFEKFTNMFKDRNVAYTLADMGVDIDDAVVASLKKYVNPSLSKSSSIVKENNGKKNKLTEPMFFWCMKASLYMIGIELAKSALNENK